MTTKCLKLLLLFDFGKCLARPRGIVKEVVNKYRYVLIITNFNQREENMYHSNYLG